MEISRLNRPMANDKAEAPQQCSADKADWQTLAQANPPKAKRPGRINRPRAFKDYERARRQSLGDASKKRGQKGQVKLAARKTSRSFHCLAAITFCSILGTLFH